MTAKNRTRPVSAADVKAFAGKAEEFLSVAQHALANDLPTAAAGNAIHAAINACDALTGSRTGRRSAGTDHRHAVDLAAALPDIGKELAAGLRRLLPMKTRAEYDPVPISTTDATRAVDQASRIVALMRTQLGR